MRSRGGVPRARRPGLGRRSVLPRARRRIRSAVVPSGRRSRAATACPPRACAPEARRRPHAPRPRGRLWGARGPWRAGGLDQAQRRPVPPRAVPSRRAAPDATRVAGDHDLGGASSVLHRNGRPAGGEDRGCPLRARRAARAWGEGPEVPCRRTRACCSASRDSPAEGRGRCRPGAGADARASTRGGAGRARRGAGRARLAGDGVLLPGRVGDVAAWYSRTELLVHPARWEGFGLALLEAMLAAKPVVATRVSARRRSSSTARRVCWCRRTTPLRWPRPFSACSDPARAAAMGDAGLARARSEFSVAKMAERTAALYTQMDAEGQAEAEA